MSWEGGGGSRPGLERWRPWQEEKEEARDMEKEREGEGE